MTEHFQAGEKQPETIAAQYIDIHLGDREHLSKQLTHEDHFQTYIRSSDEDKLPYPVQAVRLESWRSDDSEMPTIQADISFRPTDLENAPGIWADGFRWQLCKHLQQYEFEPQTLDHDPLSLYIPIDKTYCMRVALGAEPTECSVTITSESIKDIKHATHHEIPFGRAEDIEPVDRLLHIATVLGISIDELRTTFGNPRRHHKRYVLEPHQSSTQTKSLTQIERPRREQITIPEAEIVTTDQNGLLDIGGAFTAKRRLEELSAIINDPDGAALYGIQGSHFLLYGPPGTGKTSLVQALAHEIGAKLWPIRSTDIINKYVGDSGKSILDIFTKAKVVPGKLVLFFDEFDSLARKGTSGTAERIDVRKILNTEIEDVVKNHSNIIIAAATNADIDDLEPSLIRSGRVEPINVPLPNKHERLDIWGIVFLKSLSSFSKQSSLLFDSEGHELPNEHFSPYSDDIDLDALALATDGMTGADFEVILENARKKCFHHYRKTGEKTQVDQAALLQAIRELRA